MKRNEWINAVQSLVNTVLKTHQFWNGISENYKKIDFDDFGRNIQKL